MVWDLLGARTRDETRRADLIVLLYTEGRSLAIRTNAHRVLMRTRRVIVIVAKPSGPEPHHAWTVRCVGPSARTTAQSEVLRA